MERRRVGAHAGKTKWGSFAWRPALSIMLAVVLALAPLPSAYGWDAADPATASTQTTPADDANLTDESGEIETPAADSGAQEPSEATDGQGNGVDAQPAPEESEEAGADVDADADTIGEAVEDAQDDSIETDAAEGLGDIDPLADADDTVAPDAIEEDAPETEAIEEDAPETEAIEEDVAEADAMGESGDEPTQANAKRAASAGDAKSATAASSEDASPVLATVTGFRNLLIVVAEFLGKDGAGAVSYQKSYDWASVAFTSPDSIASYYSDMSNGSFTFKPAAETSAYGVDGNTNKADKVNDGVVHVSMPEAHQNWDGFETTAVFESMLGMFGRVFQAASAYVDYASYDTNGNGILEDDELAVAYVIAGYEASDNADDKVPYSIWAHHTEYAAAGWEGPESDGVSLAEYIAIGEKRNGYAASSSTAALAAKLQHELGHELGLPDLYDTSDAWDGTWGEYAVGELSLMADGENATVGDKNGDEHYSSTALDAWSRYQLGWTKPTVVKKGGVYTVTSQDSKKGYTTLLIPTSRKGEYYLIENRTFTGRDSALESTYFNDYSNGGIVIWHIDDGVVTRYLASNTVNGTNHRPGVMPLFVADGLDGNLAEYRDSIPDSYLVFWSKSVWRENYPGSTMLNLPLYGAGGKANNPGAVIFSNIRIQFLTNSGSVMKIRIFMPGDELPDEPTNPTEPTEPTNPTEPTDDPPAPPATGVHRTAAEPVYAEYEPHIPATGDEVPVGAICVLVASAALALFARNRRRSYRPQHAR